MARQPRIDRELERYLVAGEKVIVAVRRHWFHLFRQISLTVGATVLALWADVATPAGAGGQALRNLTLAAFWVSVGWLLWSVLNWRHDWFVVTDKRFLLFYGFIRRKVAMLPLLRVTDMTFDRSLLGRIVGFGTFVLESAGQKQALSVIQHVPDADRHYRAICTQLFGPGSPLRGFPGGPGAIGPTPEDPVGPDDGTGTGTAPQPPAPAPAPRVPPPSPVRVSGRGHPRRGEYGEPGDPVDPGGWAERPVSAEPESWYRSSNLRGSSHLGDTGEIPVVRTGYREGADPA